MINKIKKYLSDNTGYLIRLDDIAENMNWNMMEKVTNLFRSIDTENKLLVVNIFEDPNVFKKISLFVGVVHEEEKMPHIKRELI